MEKSWNDYVSVHGTIEGARAAFERDCAWLLQLLFPPPETVKTVLADPGDEGIDVYVGAIGVAPIAVYQCKFFLEPLGKSQKDQIRESFKRAITSPEFTVSEWVLCLPRPQLNLEENKWWVEWKSKQEQAYGITLRLLTGDELIGLMKQVGIYIHVFKLEDSINITDLHTAVVGSGALPQLVRQAALTYEAVQRTEDQLHQLAGGPLHSILDWVEKSELEQFKPLTTLRFLEGLAPQVQQAAPAGVQARWEYLLGRARQEAAQDEQAHPHFLRASAQEPTNPAYAAQAALSYVRLEMLADAAQAVAAIRRLDPLNAVAYAVDTFLHRADFTTWLQQVPPLVRKDEAFKLALTDLLLQAEPLELDKVEAVLYADLQAYVPAPILTFDNRRFQVTLAMLVVELEFKALPSLVRLDEPAGTLSGSGRLQAAYQLLTRYTALLQPTEKAPQLTHFYYVQGIAGYKLSGNFDVLREFGQRYPDLPLATKRNYVWEWACALFRAGDYPQLLAVLDELGPNEPAELDYLRYHALLGLHKPDQAKAALARHLHRGGLLHEGTFDRLLRYLAGHCADATERQAFAEDCLTCGIVPVGAATFVVKAIGSLDDPAQREQTLDWLRQATELLETETPSVVRLELARLWQLVEDYGQSAQVLASCAAAPGVQHSGIEIIRLRNQYHLFQNSRELRAGLRAWRQRHGIYPEFCNWEIELAQLLLDWERILEIAEAVRKEAIIATGAHWTYLRALYQLERYPELREELMAVVERPDLLTPEQLLGAAALARHTGEQELALRLAYPLASQPSNLVARSRYLALLLQSPEARPHPPIVALDTTVSYRVDGKPPVRLTITEPLLASGTNPLVHALLGKQVGDGFEVAHPFRRRPQQGTIVEILDCYTGLGKEIMAEMDQHEAGMPFQKFSFGSETPTVEEINQTLLEVLGEQQQENQAHAAAVRMAYREGEQNFTQLTAALHSGKGLEAYHWLTSGRDDSPGLRVIPGWWFAPIAELPQQPIVLDWTSLPLLFALARQYALPLPASLWVSHHLREELRALVKEKRRSQPVEMSVELVDGEIRPHFYPPEMHARQLEYLSDLLEWVETNCRTKLVDEKLDLLRQSTATHQRLLEQPLAGAVDAAFLASSTQAILVSDDEMVLQFTLQLGGRVLSVEAFLRACYPARYHAQLLPELLDRTYWGVQVEAPTLLREFVAAGHQFTGRARQALRNIALQVKFQPQRLRALTHFVRELYLLPGLSNLHKLQVGSFALSLGLCYLELTEATWQLAATQLAEAFFLLPVYEPHIAELLRNVWHRAERYHRS